ncbi:ABC transporter permease [Terrihabitans soli]|uniref:ABC transporter permease n=1 Tax=Terrihabitans soli TaxID=708113 RepID=A0A6S6QN86_9HYPH|nr:efflux RND transporter permease subunit [Terrihabitans soli]BCJ90419.1 ABC transporter permease [Terrihabitans soli]
MRLNISAASIKRPIPGIVLFVVLTILGLFAFSELPVTRFPNIDIPLVQVSVSEAGAAPSELESQVTKRIEDSVANLTGVKHVMSTVSDGLSSTVIEFQLETDTDRAVDDVKDAISKIRAELPRTIEEPVVNRIDVEGQSIISYAAASPGMTLEQLSWYVDDVVIRQLQGLKGVGRVQRIGGIAREIRVELDPDRLMALGVTAAEVNAQIRSINTDLAGGRGEIGGQEQTIRTLANARTVENLTDMKISLANGREVRLSELGEVKDTAEEARSFARNNGEPVVSFNIFRTKGASDVAVADEVSKKLKAMQEANPEVAYSLIDEPVSYTEGNYESAMHSLIEGAVLAIIVVFIFLRDWRATVISAIALPLSIIPTFFLMDLMGFSLNLVSLLALTLVTGILVDDAIVEIENIVRHMRMGKSPYRAAMEAADEIGLAVIAITMTIVAVFAPVSFMGGVPGQYFSQFGLTVAAAVFISLLVARLITPLIAAYFLRPHKHVEEKDGRIMRLYTGALRVSLRHRWMTLVGGIAIFIVSLMSTSLLPTGFMPNEDAARIVVQAELPPGSKLEDTRAVTDEITARLKKLPEVQSVFVMGGTTPTGVLEIRKSAIIIRLTPKNARDRSQKEIEAEVARIVAEVPDVRAWYVNERGERELSITLTGPNPDELAKGAADLENGMRRVSDFLNVAPSTGLSRPELFVEPRLDRAADLGITTDAISQTIRVATIGDVDANLAKLNTGERLIPIRVQLRESARTSAGVLEQLSVPAGSGGRSVPLSAVADVGFGEGPSSIERYDRQRRIVLGADLTGGMQLGDAVNAVLDLPEAKNLPKGVTIIQGADAEVMGEVFAGFAKAMGAGIMMVLGVLVLLFGGVFQPITILASLPLSIGGVILALLVTNNSISMPVVIGILMLMGVVTKNAIMLVDFAVESEAKGTPRDLAIIDAGRKRARPIVMTTIAMIAGMVPSALGLGQGGEFRAPMAIAVIGGLAVSTMLSLMFVPSFYTIMDDVGVWVSKKLGRFVGPTENDEDAPKKRGHGTLQEAAE